MALGELMALFLGVVLICDTFSTNILITVFVFYVVGKKSKRLTCRKKYKIAKLVCLHWHVSDNGS